MPKLAPGTSILLVTALAVGPAACAPERSAPTPAAGSTATPSAAVESTPGPAPAAPTAPVGRIVSNDSRYVVIYTTEPPSIPLNERFRVEVRVLDARNDLAPVTDADLVVDAAMPEHGHGMNVVPQVWKNNDGSYTAAGLLFHMPGRWELYFDVTRNGRTERAQTEVVLD